MRGLLAGAVVSGAVLLAGCGGDDRRSHQPGNEIRIGIADEPVLEPPQAVTTASAMIAYALMDSLVRLNDDLEPIPGAAKSWGISRDGTKLVFNLRRIGRWTNGDPLTAHDFEFSWKRALSPELAADYAFQLFGIKGAEDYSLCNPTKGDCSALADRVGVKARDDFTLEIELASPQPWFVQQAAHWAFLPVHEKTVRQFGSTWTEPDHIVTSGAYRLEGWRHGASLTLVKNEHWRGARSVKLQRIQAIIISEPNARLEAFKTGRIDALDGFALGGAELPPGQIDSLAGTADFAVYPSLGTYYFAVNTATVPDPLQRKAMALAVDRKALASMFGRGLIPATSFTPVGMPGYDSITPEFLPVEPDYAQARELMRRVSQPRRKITLYTNDAPGLEQLASQARAGWMEIGIETTVKVREWAQFLEKLGPPASPDADVFQLGWLADVPDDVDFLELLVCDGHPGPTGYCDAAYDKLVGQARSTAQPDARWKLYAQAEARLTGPDGAFPIIPIHWLTWVNLERPTFGKTFNIGPFGQIDLSETTVERG